MCRGLNLDIWCKETSSVDYTKQGAKVYITGKKIIRNIEIANSTISFFNAMKF